MEAPPTTRVPDCELDASTVATTWPDRPPTWDIAERMHKTSAKYTGLSDSSQNKIQVLVTALAKLEELRHLLVHTKNQEIENGQNMEIGEKHIVLTRVSGAPQGEQQTERNNSVEIGQNVDSSRQDAVHGMTRDNTGVLPSQHPQCKIHIF